MSNDSRNATASWSWYLHQWKVWIFVALKEISELLENWENIEELKKWRIIYENAEDFDIQLKDEQWKYTDDYWKWIVKSRHQVKAKKSSTAFSNYDSVLWIQYYKMEENIDKNWNKTINKKLKTEWFQIRSFHSTNTVWDCKIWEIEVDENNRFLHTIVNVASFKWKNENINNQSDENHYSNNPNNIQLYTYPNWDKYCYLSTENSCLKDESFKLIKEIRKIIKGDELEDENIYLQILFKLDEEIRNKHINWWFPEMSFYVLIRIISEFTTFTELENIKLRRRFYEYYDCFRVDINQDEEEKLNLLVWKISKLDIDEFIKFIYEIHPDKKYSENWFDLNEDWLHEVFFECLLKANNKLYDKYNLYIKNEDRFFLSTINKNKSRIKKVVNIIMENSRISTKIYESDYIITEYIEWRFLDYVKDYWKEEIEKEKEENNSLKYSWKCRRETQNDKITNTNLSFIKIDDAILKINTN